MHIQFQIRLYATYVTTIQSPNFKAKRAVDYVLKDFTSLFIWTLRVVSIESTRTPFSGGTRYTLGRRSRPSQAALAQCGKWVHAFLKSFVILLRYDTFILMKTLCHLFYYVQASRWESISSTEHERDIMHVFSGRKPIKFMNYIIYNRVNHNWK